MSATNNEYTISLTARDLLYLRKAIDLYVYHLKDYNIKGYIDEYDSLCLNPSVYDDILNHIDNVICSTDEKKVEYDLEEYELLEREQEIFEMDQAVRR